MVEQIYEFLTLIFRKGPEFIAVGAVKRGRDLY
jgi:hypothetical protein